MKDALEFSQKEAMYAMDDTNPLRLYDCLLPEITAYRPYKMTTKEQEANDATEPNSKNRSMERFFEYQG